RQHSLGGTGTPPASLPNLSRRPSRTFLDLPYDIRYIIYELLLVSPDPIVISPRRRHLHARIVSNVDARPQWHPRHPPPITRLPHTKPHVEILRLNRQANEEGTPLLYGRNVFVVGSQSLSSSPSYTTYHPSPLLRRRPPEF